MSVKVKICGVTRADDARAAVDAGADYVGLNFVPSSPRCLVADTARTVADAARGAQIVGVFADAAAAYVAEVADALDLALLQFHGAESPAYCRGWSRPVIKAIRAQARAEIEVLAATYGEVDHLLVDAWVPDRLGGTGAALDVETVAGLDADRLFVAGGLTADTVRTVIEHLRPFAVDVASGVERRPGVKDHAEIERFIRHAKSA